MAGGRCVATAAVAISATFWLLRSHRGDRADLPGQSAAVIVPFTSFPGQELSPAFSPDDKQLAFAWDAGGDNMDIYVTLVDAGPPLRLTTHPGVDGSPAWSPDGRRIAFTRADHGESRVLMIPALGGPERSLLSLRLGQSWYGRHPPVVWSPDGKFLAFPDRDSPQEPPGIFLLTLDSLQRRRLTTPPGQSIGDWSPAFSPDGKTLAFVRWNSEGVADIHLASLEGGQIDRLTFENAFGLGLAWTPDGKRIVFSSPRGGRVGLWSVAVPGESQYPWPWAGRPLRRPGSFHLPPSRGTRIGWPMRSPGTTRTYGGWTRPEPPPGASHPRPSSRRPATTPAPSTRPTARGSRSTRIGPASKRSGPAPATGPTSSSSRPSGRL